MHCKNVFVFLISLFFSFCSFNCSAQEVILQNAVDKFDSYQNFSYQYDNKDKTAFSDTSTSSHKFVLLKNPADKKIGYFFRYQVQQGKHQPNVALYNGNKLIGLNAANDSYYTTNDQALVFSISLLSELHWIKSFSKKYPSKLSRMADTVFNSKKCYHLLLKTTDLIVKKAHVFIHIHLFIEKATGLPVGKVTRSRFALAAGQQVRDDYSEFRYFNFKHDQANVTPSYFALPKNFHLSK